MVRALRAGKQKEFSKRPPPEARSRWKKLHEHGVADQAYSQAFNFESFPGLDNNHRVIGIFGKQLDGAGRAAQAFDRDIIAQPCHHDLAVARLPRGLNGKQVSIDDASVAHGHAAYFQEVVGLMLEQAVFHAVGLIHMFLRENGRASGYTTNQGQDQLRQSGNGQTELGAARRIDGAHCVAAQADTAGCAADQFDDAFARKGLQVLFCGVGRLEAQLSGDFGPCGWRAGARNGHLDQVQDLLLAGGELGMVEHGVSGACHGSGE